MPHRRNSPKPNHSDRTQAKRIPKGYGNEKSSGGSSRATLGTAGKPRSEYDDLQEQICVHGGELVGIRIVVAWLLACEAKRSDNPNELFQDLLEGIDAHINQASKLKQGNSPIMLKMQEAAREQVDWIIGAVHSMLGSL